MRLPHVLAAVAPMALALSACGGNDAAAPADTDTTTQPTATTTTAAAGDFPVVPLDARSSVKYAGTYALTGADGTQTTVTLGDGDSYTIRNADGTETTGTFNWYSDNSRILIGSGAEKQVYAIADGALYRLADENVALDAAKTADMTYRRIADPAM